MLCVSPAVGTRDYNRPKQSFSVHKGSETFAIYRFPSPAIRNIIQPDLLNALITAPNGTTYLLSARLRSLPKHLHCLSTEDAWNHSTWQNIHLLQSTQYMPEHTLQASIPTVLAKLHTESKTTGFFGVRNF